MERDFYTVKEFADAFGCSPDRVYEWLRAGKIGYYERPTPHAIYRIPKTELARLKCEDEVASEDSLVQQPIQKGFDPIITRRRDEHFKQLADIAKSLLDNDLESVRHGWSTNRVTGQVMYILTRGNKVGDYYDLTKEQLSCRLKENIVLTEHKYTRPFFHSRFLPHLTSELPEELKTEGFYDIVNGQPYQLIETLRLLAERKTFKGTCPVCKDW